MMSSTIPAAAARFWERLSAADLDGAFSVVSDSVTVTVPPAGITGGDQAAARALFAAAVQAFPDLLLTVRRSFVGADGVAVFEVKFEGTQAADYLGILNQEKHVDVDQVWLLGLTDGEITSIYGMWDRNQLYRRLGVKRLDSVSIV